MGMVMFGASLGDRKARTHVFSLLVGALVAAQSVHTQTAARNHTLDVAVPAGVLLSFYLKLGSKNPCHVFWASVSRKLLLEVHNKRADSQLARERVLRSCSRLAAARWFVLLFGYTSRASRRIVE